MPACLAWRLPGRRRTTSQSSLVCPSHPTGVIPPQVRGAIPARATRRLPGATPWLYTTPNEGIARKTIGHLSRQRTARPWRPRYRPSWPTRGGARRWDGGDAATSRSTLIAGPWPACTANSLITWRAAMRLLVVGGSGFLGSYVLHEAARRGHQVLALARSPQAAGTVAGQGAQPIVGDLDDARRLDEAFAAARCEALVCLASLGHGHGPTSSPPPRRLASRVPSSSRPLR